MLRFNDGHTTGELFIIVFMFESCLQAQKQRIMVLRRGAALHWRKTVISSCFINTERSSIWSKKKQNQKTNLKWHLKKTQPGDKSQRGNSKIAQLSLHTNAKRQTTIWVIIPWSYYSSHQRCSYFQPELQSTTQVCDLNFANNPVWEIGLANLQTKSDANFTLVSGRAPM